ncbi:hypothetical protein FXO38_01242 [Capsicum annuum]|nr:hypothetical protein FXO38_01242 [Capsicum annuum]
MGEYWVENRSEAPRLAEERVRVGQLGRRGHFDCQMGETVQRAIFEPNQCAIAYGSRGGPGDRVSFGLKIDWRPATGEERGWARSLSEFWEENYPEAPRLAEERVPQLAEEWVSVGQLGWWDHLDSQTGETVRMGHFQAKSVCYSPQFWSRKAGEHPSVVHLRRRGHLGGQTDKTVQTEHFRLNRCAIAHGSGDVAWVRE